MRQWGLRFKVSQVNRSPRRNSISSLCPLVSFRDTSGGIWSICGWKLEPPLSNTAKVNIIVRIRERWWDYKSSRAVTVWSSLGSCHNQIVWVSWNGSWLPHWLTAALAYSNIPHNKSQDKWIWVVHLRTLCSNRDGSHGRSSVYGWGHSSL